MKESLWKYLKMSTDNEKALDPGGSSQQILYKYEKN